MSRRIIGSPNSIATDPCIYLQLLEDSLASNSVNQVKTIHQHLLKNDYQYASIVLNKLTTFYIKLKKLKLARHVFDAIPKPEKKHKVILWNQMIRAYAWDGPFERAIQLYHDMIQIGATPTNYTYPFVLKACSVLQAVREGREIHDSVKRAGLASDVYICTALVDFYVKCGCLVDAHNVFDKMPHRDVVAWNAMIAGSSLHGMHHQTIQLIRRMQDEGLSPNSSTIVALLPAIGEANSLIQGKSVHGYCVRRNFHHDVVVGTCLLDMYAKCRCLNYARAIFDVMGASVKNEVTLSAMIGACVTCDSVGEALQLFNKAVIEDNISLSPVSLGTVLRACAKINDLNMGKRVHGYTIKSGFCLDLMVGNTIVSMYAKCGIIEDSLKFFEEIDIKDNVSYSAIISGCVQNGNAGEAFQIFRKMLNDKIDPDVTTMIGFLPACSHLAALEHGACGHSYSIVRGFTKDISICNAVIDVYCKCGEMDKARLLFDQMPQRDIVSWNSMINGYGIHGFGKDALSLFDEMLCRNIQPDDVTFISLLSACSHSGLVTEGKHWFITMSQHYRITPRLEHYLCMVDLLGRAGLLNEAREFIQTMPLKPDVRIWSALLSACKIHKTLELGEEVSRNIQNLGPESTGNFVLLSNMYSASGRWADAAHVRIVQQNKGFTKSPGCSWVEINGVVHAFVGGDKSHPEFEKINKKLEEFLVKMRELGYKAESDFVFHDVEEEEKERILLHHSEKLAVAFGVISCSNTKKPILVTKNLRVCGDCHSALKFISLITKRVIVVRDASRFHHFREGTCNCRDFW